MRKNHKKAELSDISGFRVISGFRFVFKTRLRVLRNEE